MRTYNRTQPLADEQAAHYGQVRALSGALAASLSDADATAQSMDDASPAKWHLAHTSWFFETFVLRDHVPDYRFFDERYPFLFNRSEEHTSELHTNAHLVCRLLLEKKKQLFNRTTQDRNSKRISYTTQRQTQSPHIC